MLDVRRLALFVEIVERGSMTAAAEALTYTPSAVSQQVRRLELDVGQPLVQRHARGVVPTEAGRVLLGHARTVLRQLDAAQSDLAEIAGLKRGKLAIGTFPTVGSALLPPAVRRFHHDYPDVRLNVRSRRFDELVRLVESGEVNMSLLWEYEWSRIDPNRFALTHLLDDPTTLIVSADHRLARRRSVRMDELADEEWIVRAEHPVADVLDRACLSAGFRPRIAFEANDYQEAQAMVSVQLGIALAPRTALTNRHPDVRVISLGATAPSRRVLIAQRPDRVAAPGDQALRQVLLDVADTYRKSAGAGALQ